MTLPVHWCIDVDVFCWCYIESWCCVCTYIRAVNYFVSNVNNG